MHYLIIIYGPWFGFKLNKFAEIKKGENELFAQKSNQICIKSHAVVDH